MSLARRVNFVKGWPNPYIHEHTARPASGVTVSEGLIARRDTNGAWVLGISDQNQLPYILWNGAAGDGDQGASFNKTASYQQVNYGGVQGISFNNALEIQTAAFAGNPVYGDSLYADTDGVLKICAGSATVGSKIIIATVVRASHKSPLSNAITFITIVPDVSRRISAS